MALTPGTTHTAAAVRAAAALIQWAWITLTESSALSEQDRARYVAGLSAPASLVYPLDGDPLKASVVNVAPAAARLEEGFAPYHLPERINWGSATGARISKAGRFYLIIPFRHVATRYGRQVTELRPGMRSQMLPERVYRIAKSLRPGQYLTARPVVPGRTGAVHAPGLVPYHPRFARNIRPGYTHAAKEEGLVRRPGRGRGSQYLTFRTMRQDSPGWWIPGKAGVHLRDQAHRDTALAVQAMIEAGVRADVEAALQQGRR